MQYNHTNSLNRARTALNESPIQTAFVRFLKAVSIQFGLLSQFIEYNLHKPDQPLRTESKPISEQRVRNSNAGGYSSLLKITDAAISTISRV